MNRTSFALIALVATLASLPAAAQGPGEASYELPVAATASVDRAEVRRQAVEARAAGLVASGELSLVAEAGRSVLGRAQVRAEALEALRLGVAGYGEQTVQPTAEQLASIRLAGLRAAAADAMRMAAR